MGQNDCERGEEVETPNSETNVFEQSSKSFNNISSPLSEWPHMENKRGVGRMTQGQLWPGWI